MLVNLPLEDRFFSLAVRSMIDKSKSMRRKQKTKVEKAGEFSCFVKTGKECLAFYFFPKLVIVLYARYMAYIMDTNEEERLKVLPCVLVYVCSFVKNAVLYDRVHLYKEIPARVIVEFQIAKCYGKFATFDRVKQLKLGGLTLKLRALDLPFWMLR